MPVKKTYNRNWATEISTAQQRGLLEMVTTVDERAKILAPKDTRALVNSAVISPIKDGYTVKFGGGKVPYARRRHFENFKNPGSLGYLERAGESVARGDTAKYFRDKIK